MHGENLKGYQSIQDDRGYNQIWADSKSNRIRAERRCDLLAGEMLADKGRSILEIGCGVGTKSFYLARKTGHRVLGTDLCAPFIEQAKKTYQAPNLRFDILDFNRLEGFNQEQFDYVAGDGILHHLYHQLDSSLCNMRYLLKEGGKIIFLEPNLFNPYVFLIFSYPKLRKLAHLEPAEMAFTKGFIEEKLVKAGYKNIKVRYRDFLLPGIPMPLVQPSIFLGSILEKIPGLRNFSQSLFISAEK